ANAQGLTWLAASGDSGGADCLTDTSRCGGRLAVGLPASLPELTAVRGRVFSDGGRGYWKTWSRGSSASATSYIPESAWIDSLVEGSPAATGGGVSSLFLNPSWQAGAGVPNDGARDVPDVSLAASANHDGYMIYTNGQSDGVGGTS